MFVSLKVWRSWIVLFAAAVLAWSCLPGSPAAGGHHSDWTLIQPGKHAADFELEATEQMLNPDFSKGLTGWEIVSLQGATGRWRIEQEGHTSHLVIERTNGRGTLLLRQTTPVVFQADQDYSVKAYYQTSNALQTTSLLLRVEKRPGMRDYDPSFEKGVGLASQRAPINTRPNEWVRILHEVSGSTPHNKAFLTLILDGNPCTVRVDRFELEDLQAAREQWNQTRHYSPRPDPELISKDAMLERLAALPEVEARMQPIGGMTTLLINNQPVMPVLYKQNPGQPEYHLGGPFLDHQVHLQLVDARFSDHSSPGRNIWVGHDTYDLQAGHRAIELALRGAPDAQLILDLQLNTYKQWGERYPEELFKNAQGQSVVRVGGGGHWLGFADSLDEFAHVTRDVQWQYSYFSPVWRREVINAVTTYIESLKDTPYAKRIAGVMIAGGRDGQFALRWPDHSPHAKQAFANWLQEKYESVEALAKAWNKPIESFSDITIPDDLEDGKYFNRQESDWIYDPRTEQQYIDYRIFFHEALAQLHDDIAKACKQAMGKDIIAIRYFMSGFNNGFQSTMGVSRKILPSKYVDAIAPQPAYALRKPGLPMVMRQAMESYHLHNKLVIMEFDHRTWLRTGGQGEMRHLAMSASDTLDEYAAVQRKLMGSMIARGHGFWYYDMVAGWYHDPDIQQVIGQDLQHYGRHEGKRDFRADVAVIVDEETVYQLPTISGTGHPALQRSQIAQLNLLSTAGVPYDVYYLQDLMQHDDLMDYKIYLFLSTWRVTDKQRHRLDQLKNNGRVLVWMYAPGYSDGATLSESHMEKLTGIRIASAGRQGSEPVYLSSVQADWLDDLTELQGVGHLARTSWRRTTQPTGIDSPQFYADDADATVLARFGYSQRAAIAVRSFDDWQSIYVAEPGGISADFLHRVATRADAYVLTEPTIITEMNSRFLSVHGLQGGRYTFRLPRRAAVRDLITGQVIAKDVTQFQYDVEPRESYWFGLDADH